MLKFWYDATMLSLESQRVVGLRLMKLAGGGPHAEREALRMVAEKGLAFAEAASSLAAGAPVERVMRRYRSIVRANKRRLSR